MILKRGLIAGAINLILGLLFNQLSGMFFPALAQEYQNVAIFRPWQDPLMQAYFAYPFILGFVLAYFWDIMGKQIKGDSPTDRALQFAKTYFIIAAIPGMFITYTSFQLSALMVAAWTILGFLQAFAAGLVFAKTK